MTKLEESQAELIERQNRLIEKMDETKDLLMKLIAVKDERIELYKEWVKFLKLNQKV